MILKRQSNPIPANVRPSLLLFRRAKDDRLSNRDKPGNRNRCNSPYNSHIHFSNRDKIRGVAGEKSEPFTNILTGLAYTDAGQSASSGPSIVQLLTSDLCSFLIATPANRNALNFLALN